ncbi:MULTISPECIES: protein TolR [Hyphomicrobiales]|uniref:Protein TolR n=2 Tax=Prosthecodimorpha TaxID=2981530 RepID=A0A0P6W1U8_9HYPH|nr:MULTISPECIES: protein TolR [Hyphomicrobiales]KPL52164.1 protein TolR [Prosthecomicrobium hirschii]MBT9288793.1 protein TolR [Prosthecodimorpha staleyi]MCW1843447.1 protein TolR [Prosthecomicrobium hirschii]TPQ44912.1 protein TolR [Prosthecomicrobium hirschii]
MGMAVGGGESSGGRRRRRSSKHAIMNEINMTPFIDVMLVLLIIFMVAAPLMTTGVPIDLPESKAKPLEGLTQPITISVDAKGKLFLQDKELKIEDLIPTLQAMAKNGADERIYVRGDKAADYGAVIRVMGRLNQAGFKKIGLVSTEEVAAR